MQLVVSKLLQKKAVEIGLNSKMQKMWWNHLARFPTTHLRTHTRQPSRVDRVADQPMRKKCTRQKKNTKLTGSRKGLSNLVPVPVTVPISFQPFDSDDEDGIWKLVSSRTPTRKKAVLYVGNLRDQTNEDKLIEFITKRAVMCTSESENSSVRIPKIYNCKVFQKESEAETSHCSARITIDHDSRELLCLSRFWPNGTYARPWKFRNSQPSDALAVSSSEITGDSAAKGPE